MFKAIPRRFILALTLSAVLLAACSALPGGTSPTATPLPPTEPPPPTETPTPAAGEPTAEPTVEATSEGPSKPTDEPTEEATAEATEEPSSGGISENAIMPENVRDLAELRSADVSQSVLLSAQFSTVDHRIATYGFDKVVRIFDGDSLDLLNELYGHGDYGYSVDWSPDGQYVASGGDYTAKVWDTSDGKEANSTAVASWGYRISWHPDGDRFAIVGDPSSRVEIINTGGGKITDIKPGNYTLWSVQYSPDGKWLAAGSGNARLFVYDAETLALEREIPTSGTVWDVEFSPDGSVMAACNDGGKVELFSTDSWVRDMSESAYPLDCSDGAFSPTGDIYFTGGDDGRLIAWDPATGSQLASINTGNFIWWVSVSFDGELVAVALDDGSLKIFGLN